MVITINKRAAYILPLIILVIHNVFAEAEISKFNPSISAGLIYTDNVDLTHTNKDSDLVFRVTPSLGSAGISTQGSRLTTQLNYSVSGLSYESDTSNNDLYHNLSSSATAEIVKNAVFLDGFANKRKW